MATGLDTVPHTEHREFLLDPHSTQDHRVARRLHGVDEVQFGRVQEHRLDDEGLAQLDELRPGVGVCRNFTHLAVAFCRAMNIPARYCNGYLGDIGIPPQDVPMDFAAWMEVFLGGPWHTFDPRQ